MEKWGKPGKTDLRGKIMSSFDVVLVIQQDRNVLDIGKHVCLSGDGAGLNPGLNQAKNMVCHWAMPLFSDVCFKMVFQLEWSLDFEIGELKGDG